MEVHEEADKFANTQDLYHSKAMEKVNSYTNGSLDMKNLIADVMICTNFSVFLGVTSDYA